MGWRGFFRRLRPNRAPVLGDPGWQVGDLAECVTDGPWQVCTPTGAMIPSTGPQQGEVRIVIATGIGPHPLRESDVIWLHFARYEGRYSALNFRKIVPQADRAERGAADFLPWLRRFAGQERAR